MPEIPTLFTKFADTLTACDSHIALSGAAYSMTLDWGAELAVVVGAVLRFADRDTTRDGIAGYRSATCYLRTRLASRPGRLLPRGLGS
jgi:acylpyruvate hydrolase